MQNLMNETEPGVWPQIAPLLDPAMASLSEADRQAVVLRFFDGRNMSEVGLALGVSEDSAKKRVHRAVDKLRRFFTKRGILIPVAALTAAIAGNSVQAAPAALAKTATAVAVVQGATASGPILALVDGTLKGMAWLKAKAAIPITGMATLLAGISMRELGFQDTLYLCLGLMLCLVLPVTMSVGSPRGAAVKKSCMRIVWGGQVLLAMAGLIVVFSESMATYAIVIGSAGYLGCFLLLLGQLRGAQPVGAGPSPKP